MVVKTGKSQQQIYERRINFLGYLSREANFRLVCLCIVLKFLKMVVQKSIFIPITYGGF